MQVSAGGLQTAINDRRHCGDTLQPRLESLTSGAYTCTCKTLRRWALGCHSNCGAGFRICQPKELASILATRASCLFPGRPAFGCPRLHRLGDGEDHRYRKASQSFNLPPGANHYRIGPGLEITRQVGDGVHYGLLQPAAAADHIVIDRDWIHGTAQDETVRGVFLSGVQRH
jgi:hypothetical protein